jgi:hypothetical protein
MTTIATPPAGPGPGGAETVRAELPPVPICGYCGGPTRGITDGLTPPMYASRCVRCRRLRGWWTTLEAAWDNPPGPDAGMVGAEAYLRSKQTPRKQGE